MEDYRKIYDLWLTAPEVDEDTKKELETLSEKEIEDRFYRELEFGTAGMRGVLGAGTKSKPGRRRICQIKQSD